MFGLFKKLRSQPPPIPSRNPQFQSFFATKWIHSALTTSIAGFSGAVLCGDGTKVLTNAWKKMWASNLPNEPLMEPNGLSVEVFKENDRLIVFITFPPPSDNRGAHFGIVVLGPCEDPEWGPDGRANLPFRYFVLLGAANGTSIEEWTGDPPTPLGAGPEPEARLFVEWVLNHAVRSAAETTVSIRRGEEAVVAAIARARSELPTVLHRFLEGEFQDMGFTVKVPIKEGEVTEHFWLSDTTFSDGAFTGVIDAEPQAISTIKRGDRWTVRTEDVVDWMYLQDRKMHGNYTLRALLPKMPPEQAAMYRAHLADEEI